MQKPHSLGILSVTALYSYACCWPPGFLSDSFLWEIFATFAEVTAQWTRRRPVQPHTSRWEEEGGAEGGLTWALGGWAAI